MPRSLLYLVFTLLLLGCSEPPQDKVGLKEESASLEDSISEIKASEATIYSSSNSKKIIFNKTGDASEIIIPEEWFDTPAAKKFLFTGKNDYVGNPEMIALGKKRYNMWSCSQCHGPTAGGQVGPGLTGPNFNHKKNTTNHGMFETIWAGTNGGMGAKGFGLMTPDDGIKPDELLKIIAFIRSNGALTGNE
ncbi:MAG: c-type cytochrome [Methylophilales bacterium]|jgi:cytochrome c-L|nr:c-type cytochrome [Methylophilales bacterium]